MNLLLKAGATALVATACFASAASADSITTPSRQEALTALQRVTYRGGPKGMWVSDWYGGRRAYGYRYGWAGPLAFGAAVVGSALAAPYYGYDYGYAPADYSYGYSPDYYSYSYSPGYYNYGYSPNYNYGYSSGYSTYGYTPGYSSYGYSGRDASWCMAHYRSYDPASGTYMGFDGMRHSCP